MTATSMSRNATSSHGLGSTKSVDIDEPQDPVEELEEEVVIQLRVDPLLQQNASPVDIDKGLRLIQSCRDGDIVHVERQIAEGSPAGFVTKTGWTPIAAAAYGGKSELVRYLLEIGADAMYTKTNKRSASSYGGATMATPISGADSAVSLGKPPSSDALDHHLSSDNSSSNIADTSVSAQATASSNTPVKKTTVGSNTPLHWACYRGHAEVVTILMHAGYGIEDMDSIGNRCLHLACSGGYRDVVEILLANSAAIDQRNRYGNRPLDMTTDPTCRKLLLKFQSHTSCEWCKETFSRIRRPSLCQHCHNVYCDVKPCSSITEISTPVDALRPGTASTTTVVRSMRYCQECATEMGKTEQDLRFVLDTKLELIRSALAIITEASTPEAPPATEATSRPGSATTGSSAEGTGDSTAAVAASDVTVSESVSEMEGVEPPTATDDSDAASAAAAPPPPRRILTSEDIFRALNLSQTDAEALYTSIEAAHSKAVDRELILRAKRVYHQLVAHVALQEEIKALMVVRPIGVRSLIEPLRAALAVAKRESVSNEMLELAIQVIHSAEAECTLFGCHALCAKIELGTAKYRRDIARLEASIAEAQTLGVNDKLLGAATTLRDRLNAEVQLQACLKPYMLLTTVDNAGVDVPCGYRFEDGTEVSTLLQALELRNHKIQSAVDFGATVDGVSSALLEEGANILKQLKKEIKDEMKAEEERRRLEEEAALKAAKKGKKKKA